MMHVVRGFGLTGSLLLVSTLAVVSQAWAQTTTSPYANVYVQKTNSAGPVYGFAVSSTGQLNSIPGSPFNLGSQIVGGTPSRFFTLGHTLIHSFAVTNGSIQSQLSQMPIFSYAGGSCGNAQSGQDAAVLDHSGKYIYVTLQAGGGSCAAYQTYIISSDGSFSFDGDTEINWNGNGSSASLPSILGNESFAYADYSYLDSGRVLSGFQRQSSGTLQLMQFKETDPTLPNDYYTAGGPDASPTGNYLVAQLLPAGGGSTQLGVYTVDSQGNISTTNTSANMPVSAFVRPRMKFSPSGNLIAAFEDGLQYGSANSGIEIYNFDGAAPLTLYKTLLTGTPIDDLAWDSSNHLYAISTSKSMVYVFTVTPTSVTQDSTYSLGSPVSLVVVSQPAACSAPASDGVNVCSPANGATITSPVNVTAAATVTGGVYRFELWSGNTKLVSMPNSGIMNQSVSLAPGTYHLTFAARNSSGTHQYATRDITVK